MRTALIMILVAACGVSEKPAPTGTVCPTPDPMTMGYTLATTPGCTGTPAQCNFAKTFMDAYCINCHQVALLRSQRHGAPLLHDFDTFDGAIHALDHTDQQAGIGPLAHNHFMPGAGTDGRCPSVPGGPLDEACPQPTDAEREDLAAWAACETLRPHEESP